VYGEVRLGLPPEKDVVCWAGGGTSYFKERKEKTRGVYGGRLFLPSYPVCIQETWQRCCLIRTTAFLNACAG